MMRYLTHSAIVLLNAVTWPATTSHSDNITINIAEDFATNMEFFSDIPPVEDRVTQSYNAEGPILELFDPMFASTDEHACDLQKQCGSTLSLETYLDLIRNDYGNYIPMRFTKIEALPCIEHISSNGEKLELRFVVLTKEVVQNNESVIYKEVLVIDVLSETIRGVVFPEDLDQSFINSCDYLKTEVIYSNSGIERKKRFENHKYQAELASQTGSISEAISHYESALKFGTCTECESAVENLNASMSAREQLADSRESILLNNYEEALTLLSSITPTNDSEQKEIDELTQKCKKGINAKRFDREMEMGVRYQNQKYYAKARLHFERAIAIRPKDINAQAKLKECMNADSTYIISRINEAIADVERANKKEKGVALKSLLQLESSGRFPADLYYKIALMLDGNERNLRGQMGYSRRQAFQTAKLYCLKAKQKGNEDARWMWFNIFSKASQKK